MASLSGINRLGAQLRLFFGAYGGDLDGFPTNQFPIGKPMPIIASLTDMKGPVLDARIAGNSRASRWDEDDPAALR